MGLQISLCKFHKNNLSEILLDGKDVTLWDELTEQKAGSQKHSFQFLTEDISFFTIALYGLPNMTLKIPQEQSYWYASWGESYTTVRWIKRTQCSFWESFFSVFILGYFLFRHNHLWSSNITLQIPQEQSQWTVSWGESCNYVRWINRIQSSLWEIFIPDFNGRYFLFHHSPLRASKYHFSNSRRTVLVKCFWRGKLLFCEMNKQNTKQFLRKLLSSFERKIFPFSP